MTEELVQHAELLGIRTDASPAVDVYSGVARLSGRIWASRHRALHPSETVVLVVHPTSNFLGHYALAPLAARGLDAVGMTTRYLGNDTSLIVENCLLDIAATVHAMHQLEYQRVVLVGNSGGGSLVALYQSQAERPTIRATPSGDPPDLTTANLPPVDGLVLLMSHPGRAAVYTEWLDPAIVDEHDPFIRNPELDMFDRSNGPPFSGAFLARYRAAQIERNRRITAWVRGQLSRSSDHSDGQAEDLPFVVHGTCADPRFIDLYLDASDRVAGTLWGDPYAANLLPATLGHFTSLRSWLSQWSLDDSRCDALTALPHVSVPVHVIWGTADQSVFPSHAKAIYDSVTGGLRHVTVIKGATHYFAGQPELLGSACDRIVDWVTENIQG